MTQAPTRPARNGVDVPTLFATLDAVKANQGLAAFRFRARNEWLSGTHNRSTIEGFYGAGQETSRAKAFTYDADHPPVLVGADNAPTPVEFLLHAIAACLTSGLANIAAARASTCAASNRYLKVAERSEALWEGTAWQACLVEIRAHIARAEQHEPEARRLLNHAATMFEAAGHPLDAQRCRAVGV
jgi:uncharacterized OsmC-like protein